MVYLRLAYRVVLDEVFQVRSLIGRQLPKSHSASLHRYATGLILVSYLELRNGFKVSWLPLSCNLSFCQLILSWMS